MVIQDMLRVFIIRIACQKAESCSILLRPIFSWILDHAYDFSSPSDVDAYKASLWPLLKFYSLSNLVNLNV